MTKNILITLSAAAFLFYGCNTVNSSEPEVNEEELEIAGEIIGGSLSEQQGGVLSSMYDAFSTISQTGISYLGENQAKTKSSSSDSNDYGRGGESAYSGSYNPETGEHIISFTRSFEGPNLTKNLAVLNKYIFTDASQEFLEWPRRQKDQIETIDFKGLRSGSAETERRTSTFTRTDTLFASGFSDESSILSIEGSHSGQGQMALTLPRLDRSGERIFNVSFDFQNIQIDKAVVQENGTLEEGITGLITYNMQMTRTVDGDTTEKSLSGTIELTGDGTALLRFKKFRKTFRIALSNGLVTE